MATETAERDIPKKISQLESELLAARQYLGTVRGVDMIEQLEIEREIEELEASLFELRRQKIRSWARLTKQSPSSGSASH